MARNDDHKYESYPKDSFDNPPTGPIGVHNGRRSWPVRLTPYAIVIVVAAAVGVLFWSPLTECQRLCVGIAVAVAVAVAIAVQ